MANSYAVSQAILTGSSLAISFSGEITFQEYRSALDDLAGVFEHPTATAIEVDLSDLVWIDSTGLRLLSGLYKRFVGHMTVIVTPGSQPEMIVRRMMSPLLPEKSVPRLSKTVAKRAGLIFEFAGSSQSQDGK